MASNAVSVSCFASTTKAGVLTSQCGSCKDSCTCNEGCKCTAAGQAQSAQQSTTKARCQCNEQCPCKKVIGDTTATVAVQLCASGEERAPCTVPGNCCCNKGSVGKL